jgi:hypothetical protein
MVGLRCRSGVNARCLALFTDLLAGVFANSISPGQIAYYALAELPKVLIQGTRYFWVGLRF